VCVVALAVPALAGAAGINKATAGISATPSATKPHWLCPQGACEAIAAPTPIKTASGYQLPDSTRSLEGSGELGGYDPSDLKSAYKIPSGTSGTITVAVVDAFGYPNAEADLAAYRSRYGLPACTKASGCFKKVNEKGEEANYPAEEPGWDGEAALDVDMVSAACPECDIMMVEADGEADSQLGNSVDEAVAKGANEVSNSYGLPELYEPWCQKNECETYNADYDHPGVEIFASAGDHGYLNDWWNRDFGTPLSADWPASVPSVVSVGGTALHKASGSRGWHETVWNEPGLEVATGSGCTVKASKPSWQKDTGCTHRTENDVSAVAAVETGVSVRIDGAWEVYGGTSVSSPLLAGIEAHASQALRTEGADGFYIQPSTLFDVTEGFDSFAADECTSDYLCTAQVGYDGPTGLGTPDGVPAAPAAPTAKITSPTTSNTYTEGTVVKTKFSCTEGTNGSGLESCTDSSGHSGTEGTLDTGAPGLFTYTVTATSKDGLTGTANLRYAVQEKGTKLYEYCGSDTGCGFTFIVNSAKKEWEAPNFGESGFFRTVKGSKPTAYEFVDLANGCTYTGTKNTNGYNTSAAQGPWTCSGVVDETWYASIV
jgi:hypothetical protein